ERGKLVVASLLRVDHSLVGMNVIGEIPVRVPVLSCEAVRIDRRVNGPRMNLGKRKVLIDECYAVAILLQQPGKENAVRLRTVRALQVVKVDEHNLCVRVA